MKLRRVFTTQAGLALLLLLLLQTTWAQPCPYAACEWSPFLRDVHAYNVTNQAAWENRHESALAETIKGWESFAMGGSSETLVDILVAAELAWRYTIPSTLPTANAVSGTSSDATTLLLSIDWSIVGLTIALLLGTFINIGVFLCLLRSSKDRQGTTAVEGGKKKGGKGN